MGLPKARPQGRGLRTTLTFCRFGGALRRGDRMKLDIPFMDTKGPLQLNPPCDIGGSNSRADVRGRTCRSISVPKGCWLQPARLQAERNSTGRRALLWRRGSFDETNPSQPRSRREEAGRLAIYGKQHSFPCGRMLVPPDNVRRHFYPLAVLLIVPLIVAGCFIDSELCFHFIRAVAATSKCKAFCGGVG
jgi:hypothetical protein